MKHRSSVRLALLLGWGAVLPLAWPAPTFAQYDVSVSAEVPPPPLPVYMQPPIPAEGYLWVPGYWAWNRYDYFWVPGYWTLPPEPGLLWTPGYWGWNNGAYVFNAGYWAPTIGFYGGVNYGFGYFGNGFAGGYWRSGRFFYNSAVMNVGAANITNVYVNNVTVNRNVANVSYNGGPGGLRVEPTPAERAALSQARIAPTPAQMQHYNAARADGALAASANHGVPPIAATP
ncbi:MAG: YXWGXW repeat-containing protein, partial [Methylocystis sp.]